MNCDVASSKSLVSYTIALVVRFDLTEYFDFT